VEPLSTDRADAAFAFTRDELVLLNNALNEVCNGAAIEDWEFSTRLGADRSEALSLLRQLGAAISKL